MKKEGETHVNLREVRNLKVVIFFPLLYKSLYWNVAPYCPWSNFEQGHLWFSFKKNWLLAGCSLGSPTPNRGRVVHRWNAMIFNNIFEKLSDKKWKYNRKILPWHKNILIIWQNSVVLGHIETSMFLMPFSIFEEL